MGRAFVEWVAERREEVATRLRHAIRDMRDLLPPEASGQVRREASRERIILSLRLAPHEFEALLTPGTGAPDIRSVFRIDTGAGVVRAALHAVGDYDPAKASVRCTFNRLMED